MRWKEGREGGSSLEIVQLDAEGFAAVEVVDEGVVALFRFVRVFLGEVDEVGAVREDVTWWGVSAGRQLLFAP